ncbi:MAG: hypothetical protein K2M34_05305 [Alphaproteobacteria bacterium]|nr:hypothetical protein [Alphaproteobacteria bacterium]
MMDYSKVITLWRGSVEQYCMVHNIPNMDLKNLRQGDVYNYDLYTAYKNVENAIAAYTKTPSSPLYAKELLDCIQKWYILTSTSKKEKMSMRIMPKIALARMIDRVK